MSSSAATWYVRADGVDGDDGKTWATAQESIRLGIDNCKQGDTVYVGEGTYYEGLVLKDGIAVIGVGEVIVDGTNLGTRLITCEADCQKPTLVQNIIFQNARHDQLGGGAWLRGKVTMRRCVVRGCSGKSSNSVPSAAEKR